MREENKLKTASLLTLKPKLIQKTVLTFLVVCLLAVVTNTMAATPPLLPFDQTGDLLVLDHGSDNILRITPAGGISIATTGAEILAVAGWDPAGNLRFDEHGIAFDASGNYYFSASANFLNTPSEAAVFRVASTSGVISVLTSYAQLGAISATDPKGIAFGSDGMLYAIDNGSDSVLQIDPGTGSVSVYVDRATLEALPEITSISFDTGSIVGVEGGTLVVASQGNPNAIISITGGTPSVLASGAPFSDLDVYMTRAANGDLIISDDSDRTVYRVTMAGVVTTFLSQAALEAVTGSTVDLEGGIAFDDAGNFYVAEENSDSILRFDPSLNGSVFVSEADILAATGFSPDFDGGIAFAPPSAPTMPVPTLNHWGITLFLLLLSGVALLVIRRKVNIV